MPNAFHGADPLLRSELIRGSLGRAKPCLWRSARKSYNPRFFGVLIIFGKLHVVEDLRSKTGLVLCCVCAMLTLTLLTVASCTSSEDFNRFFQNTSIFLSLDESVVSRWLLQHSTVGHAVAYTVLCFVLSLTFSGQRLFVASLLACCFGLLMEGIQAFIPTRGASWADMGSNVLGVSIGFCLYLLWMAYVRRREATTPPTQAVSAAI